MLENAVKPENYRGPSVEFILRSMTEPNDEALERILKSIVGGKKSATVGKFLNESGIGKLADEWKKMSQNENYNISLNFKKLFGIYNIKIYNKYRKYFD